MCIRDRYEVVHGAALFCCRKRSIGKGCCCAESADAFAGKPRSYKTCAIPVGARLAREWITTDEPAKKQIVYNFLYLTGTISYFFENIPIPDVTAMRHGVAERRN